MKTRLDFVGYEFDWFATDAEGRLALFSSAGWGPVPDFVFENFEGQQAIEQHIGRLVGMKPYSFLPNGFQPFLESGLFAYDWHDTFGPYRSCGIPSDATHIAQLIPLRLHNSLVVLPELHFCLAWELRPQEIPSYIDVSR